MRLIHGDPEPTRSSPSSSGTNPRSSRKSPIATAVPCQLNSDLPQEDIFSLLSRSMRKVSASLEKSMCLRAVRIVALGVAFALRALGQVPEGSEPPELTALRASYESKLAPARAKLAETVKTRTDRYVRDLLALEAQLSAKARPDDVILVRGERDAYGSGRESVGFDPKDKRVPPALVQLRLAFDRDVTNTRVSLSAAPRDTTSWYLKQLDALDRQLTAEKRMTAIPFVRAERDSVAISMSDPLKTYLRSPVGAWKWSNGETRTFEKDGTWKSDKQSEGTWIWTVEEKGEFTINQPKRKRAEMVITPDGKRITGGERAGALQDGQRVR
jgi:hypothetical protein